MLYFFKGGWVIPRTLTSPSFFLQPRYLPQIITNIYFIYLAKGGRLACQRRRDSNPPPAPSPPSLYLLFLNYSLMGFSGPPSAGPCCPLVLAASGAARGSTPQTQQLWGPLGAASPSWHPLLPPPHPSPHPHLANAFLCTGICAFFGGGAGREEAPWAGDPSVGHWGVGVLQGWGAAALGLGWGGAAACLQP